MQKCSGKIVLHSKKYPYLSTVEPRCNDLRYNDQHSFAEQKL